MINIEFVFILANILITIGSIGLFKKVFRRNSKLEEYDFFGSLFTFLGLLTMVIGYLKLEMFFALSTTLPVLLVWLYIFLHVKL